MHEHQTNNASFGTALKSLYRGVQLRHHRENWNSLPKPIERKVDQLFQSLTPPVPDEELMVKLDSLQQTTKHEIRTLIITHLNTQLAKNSKQLRDTFLDQTDRQAAKLIATRITNRKYENNNIQQWLETDINTLGNNWYEETENTETVKNNTTDTTVIPPITGTDHTSEIPEIPQTIRKRRRDSAEAAVPVSNRFSLLTDEPVEADGDTVTNPTKIPTVSPATKNKNENNSNITTANENDNNDMNTSANDNQINANTDLEDGDTWSMTSSQCDQLLTSQPSKSPNRTSPRKNKNVFVHDKELKKNWKLQIRNQPNTVLVTDSNFRLASDIPIPDDWEVHVYPGNAFLHTNNILKTAEIPSCVQNVVLAVGINHRGWSFTASVRPDWNKLLTTAKSLKPALHFLGVSTVNPCETIKRINEEGQKSFGTKFIPALPENQVAISPTDPHKIHHDKCTVERIITSIKIHLN